VEQGGRLLFYRDQTQNGTGDVSSPAVIGLGGWQDFRFLFSGGNGIIYAVDGLVQEPNRYEIEGHLEVQAPAQIAFSRSSLDFGLLGIGEVATRTLRISSGGAAPATLTMPGSTGGVFSWQARQATLPPAAGIDVEVEVSPLASGTARGALTVTSNAQGSPHTITLSGSGRREIPN
jgi:hypothetical protein